MKVEDIAKAAKRLLEVATTPMKPKFMKGMQDVAEKTPVMPFLKGLTPKAMMNFKAPLEDKASQLSNAVKGGMPITQIPEVAGAAVRQMGRYAGLQPSPLDVAVLPAYARMMKGAAPTPSGYHDPKRLIQPPDFTDWSRDAVRSVRKSGGTVQDWKRIVESDIKQRHVDSSTGQKLMREAMDYWDGEVGKKSSQAGASLSNPSQHPITEGEMRRNLLAESMRPGTSEANAERLRNQAGFIDFNAPIGPDEVPPAVAAKRAALEAKAKLSPNKDTVSSIQKKLDIGYAVERAKKMHSYGMSEDEIVKKLSGQVEETVARKIAREASSFIAKPISSKTFAVNVNEPGSQAEKLHGMSSTALQKMLENNGVIVDFNTPKVKMVELLMKTGTNSKKIPSLPSSVTSRPQHQAAIERAINSGNIKEAEGIIAKMDPKDAYKQSMSELVARAKKLGVKSGSTPPTPPTLTPEKEKDFLTWANSAVADVESSGGTRANWLSEVTNKLWDLGIKNAPKNHPLVKSAMSYWEGN